MSDLLSSDFFATNRAKLRLLFKGTAPIVISANGLLQQNSDNTFPFRQDSSFWYLTGIDVPGSVLVMDKGGDYLIMATRGEHEEIFDSPVDWGELSKASGITTILAEDEGWKQLGSKIKRVKHIATLSPLPEYIKDYGFYSNPTRSNLIKRMKTYNDDLDFLDLRPHLTKMRSIKQHVEIEAIEAAIDITRQTLKYICKNLQKYKFEYEIEAVVLSEFRRHKSKPAYGPIVAGGKNATTLHYNSNNSILDPKDLILLDIGAEIEYYSSDITRTISINSQPTKRQRQVYESVLEVQNFALGLIKPGTSLKECEEQIEHFMGEQLRVLGLIKSIDEASVKKYYPHHTSHFLGLDTHDVGSFDQPLEANMIITVEPGIYIPEEGIGVRIEDDVKLTDDGYQLLTDNLPSLIN